MTPFEIAQLASIPVTSAIVGWGTNVLALKMTFYPVSFIGIPPYLGWQGIIPAKAKSMAERTVDLITTKLVGVQEVIDRLDPKRVSEELSESVAGLMRDVIDDVMSQHEPQLWLLLPDVAKEEIYARAIEHAPAVIEESVVDLKIEVHEVLDLKTMAVAALLEDRAFLNQIFLECGREEFKFIEKSGLYFGFAFGLMLMGIWIVAALDWMMPLVGFLIGWATNYLALKMIFEPEQPKKILGFTWQGGFLKRQDEVSEAYARLVTQNIVNARNILRALFEGPGADRLLGIIDRHVQDAAEQYAVVPDAVTSLLIGGDNYQNIKQTIAERIVDAVPGGPVYVAEGYAEEALDLENTLRERLKELPPGEFAGLLRPIFQEDEWKLLLVGAVLGLLVGVFQAFVVLA